MAITDTVEQLEWSQLALDWVGWTLVFSAGLGYLLWWSSAGSPFVCQHLVDKAQRGSFGEISHERYCCSFGTPHPVEVGCFPWVVCLYHNIHVSFNMKLRKCIDSLSIDPILFVFWWSFFGNFFFLTVLHKWLRPSLIHILTFSWCFF